MLKKTLSSLLLALCALTPALAQQTQTTTPNLTLSIPYNHETNWGPVVVGDLSIIDSAVGGTKSAPWSLLTTTPFKITNSVNGIVLLTLDLNGNLTLSGGATFSGPVVLPGNPTIALQAATKQYVDQSVTAAISTSEAASALTLAEVTALGTLANNTTGNAATASALASAPGLCPAGQLSRGISANGTPTCITPSPGALNGQPLPLNLQGDNTLSVTPDGMGNINLHAIGVLPVAAGAAFASQYNDVFSAHTLLTPSVAVASTDTSFTFPSTAGFPPVGCGGWISGEADCWTGNTGTQLTGITPYYGTTRTAHGTNPASDYFGGYALSESSATNALPSHILFNNGWEEYGGTGPSFPNRFEVQIFAAGGLASPYNPIYAGTLVAGGTVGPGSCNPVFKTISTGDSTWYSGTSAPGCVEVPMAGVTAQTGAAYFASIGATQPGSGAFTTLTKGGNQVCDSSGAGCPVSAPGSNGTVTTFTAGLLSPLFSTSVANPTTSPALSFTLLNALQNSVFAGPPSGGNGSPSYQTAPTFSAANLTNFPTLNQNTTGNAGTATALAGTPLACTGGNVSTGISPNGNAICTAPSGSVTLGGDVTGPSGSSTVAAVHATSGTLNGVAIGQTTRAAGSFSGLSVWDSARTINEAHWTDSPSGTGIAAGTSCWISHQDSGAGAGGVYSVAECVDAGTAGGGGYKKYVSAGTHAAGSEVWALTEQDSGGSETFPGQITSLAYAALGTSASYPASSSFMEESSGTAFFDSVGSSTSSKGGFVFRCVTANATSYSTCLAGDSSGDWTLPGSLTASSTNSLYSSVTGTTSTYSASSLIDQWAGGNAYFYSVGSNASTKGGFLFQCASAGAALNTNCLTGDSSGNWTLPGQLQAATVLSNTVTATTGNFTNISSATYTATGNTTGISANSALLQENGGTAYMDSIGGSSVKGGFTFRCANQGETTMTNCLVGDNAGNWTAAGSLHATNFSGLSTSVYGLSSSSSAYTPVDTGLSRLSAGTVVVGNGSPADESGTLIAANLTAMSSLSSPNGVFTHLSDADLSAGSLYVCSKALSGGAFGFSTSGCPGLVTSFNGRAGAVLPLSGDYTVSQVTGAAPLASPAFTGSPTIAGNGICQSTGLNCQTAVANLGFTPVQQGTGVGQGSNLVKIGWKGTTLGVTVDSTDNGTFILSPQYTSDQASVQSQLAAKAPLASPTFTGTVNAGNIVSSGQIQSSTMVANTITANTGFVGNLSGNAATATNVPYSGLTGTVTTWNQSTTGNAATATNLAVIPNQCSNGQVATGIGRNGAANCVSITLSAGSIALPTVSIPAGSCHYAGGPGTAGVTSSSVIVVSFATDPSTVTGYGAGGLTVYGYYQSISGSPYTVVTVCNPTSAAITPGAMTANIRIIP